MSTMNELYRQVIVEHFKNPRNKGLINSDDYQNLRLKNPSCGDDVTICVKIENGVITDVRHDGSGCSICCSSASVMSEVIKGKTIDEAYDIIEDFYNLIKGEEVKDADRLDEAMAFGGVAQFPARVKCATLSWKALGALISFNRGEDDAKE